jgi:hypothetical protein
MYSGLDRHWVDTAIAIGVVAVLAALVWFGIRGMDQRERAESAGDQTASAGLTAAPGTGDALVMETAPLVIQHQLTPEEALVYECLRDGQKSISDRPCGPGAVARIIDGRELNTYRQAPIAPVDMSRHRQPPTAANPEAATLRGTQPNVARCEAIQDEIDRLNARMRQPYGSQEGEWLRKRWQSLKELYYDEDCGKLNLPRP